MKKLLLVLTLSASLAHAASPEYCGANTTSSTSITCELVETIDGRVTALDTDVIQVKGMSNLGVVKSRYIKASILTSLRGAEAYIQGRYENVPTYRAIDLSAVSGVCNSNQVVVNETFTTVNANSKPVVANVTCRLIKSTQNE